MGPVVTQFSHHTEPLLAVESCFNLLRLPTQLRPTTLIPFTQLIKCPFSRICAISRLLFGGVGGGVVTSSV